MQWLHFFFFFKLLHINNPQKKLIKTQTQRNIWRKKGHTYHHELASTTTCMRRVRIVRAKTQCLESNTLLQGQLDGRHTQPSPRFILPLIWGRTQSRMHISLTACQDCLHMEVTQSLLCIQEKKQICGVRKCIGIIFSWMTASIHSVCKQQCGCMCESPGAEPSSGSRSECESPRTDGRAARDETMTITPRNILDSFTHRDTHRRRGVMSDRVCGPHGESDEGQQLDLTTIQLTTF